MLPAEIGRFAERVRGFAGASVTQATGLMFAAFPDPEQIPSFRSELESAKGSLMVLKQPAASSLSCWGQPPDSLPLMREIKRRFDSEAILNPGRFLGAI
jgi:glycolate dehydrogenase FAD-binding subunit